MMTTTTISTTRSATSASSPSTTTTKTRTKTTTQMRMTPNTMNMMLNGRQRRRQRRRKDNRGANKTASSSSSSSSSPLSSSFDDDDDEISKNLTATLDKLLVPFLALRRGSRFAHQEFVMAATEAYDEAISLGKLKTETYVLGLNSNISSKSSKSSNNGSLGTSEQEAFLSHLSMVYCTLHYMGRASKKTDAFLVDPEKDKELKGILGYIKMTHTNRDENGITLKRMEFEQRRVLNASEPNEDPRKYSKWDNSSGRNPNAKVNDVRQITPGILLMRTNARLSLLAKEMVEGPEGRKKDLPEVSEDEGEAVPTATTTTTTSRAIEPQLALEWSFRPRNDPELLLKRTLAARALTAFFSVLTAHPKGLKAFSLACVEAYEANISAEELVQSVSAAEFDCEATTRGMFGKGADAPKLFAGFVSAAYLTAEYRLEQENKQQTTEKKKKTFAFSNPPRWEEIDLSSNGQDDIESRKKGNAYDYNFEFNEGRQIKYLEGFKTSIARWVSIGEKELFADVSTGLSVDEDNDEYDFDAAFKTAAAKQRQNMAGAPFADDDDSLSSSSTYQPSEDDEPVLDVNALYAKLLFEVSGYIGNQSDQPKVAALLQAYTQKILNAPIVQPPSLSQKSYDPESGEFLAVRAARDDDDHDVDLSFKRNANNDFFAQSSITLASLNVQRAICSFVLKEMSNKS
ncbi:unnamed protein product [Bathycoccus prasinos]